MAKSGLALDNVPPPRVMPAELAERGWRLLHVLRGDKWRARNEKLGLSTSAAGTPDDAITQARALDSGKRLSVSKSGEVEFKSQGSPESRDISRAAIRLDGGTQPREGIDQKTVDDYADDMLAGDVFPDVVLFHDGKHYWLADGFHRYFGSEKAHKTDSTKVGLGINASVYKGTKRDALLYSLGANATHGLPRSPEDKRRAVLVLLKDEEWSGRSDGWIAKAAKVSQPFVSKLRRQLSEDLASEATQNVLSADDESVEISVQEKPPTPKPASKVRTDARGRQIDTTNIGKRPSAKVSSAITDIRVDDDAEIPVRTNPQPSKAPSSSPVNWPDLQVAFHLTVTAGKKPNRRILISGKAGDSSSTAKPVYFGNFTLADLEPVPRPIAAVVKALAPSAARQIAAAASKKTAPKKKAKKKK